MDNGKIKVLEKMVDRQAVEKMVKSIDKASLSHPVSNLWNEEGRAMWADMIREKIMCYETEELSELCTNMEQYDIKKLVHNCAYTDFLPELEEVRKKDSGGNGSQNNATENASSIICYSPTLY